MVVNHDDYAVGNGPAAEFLKRALDLWSRANEEYEALAADGESLAIGGINLAEVAEISGDEEFFQDSTAGRLHEARTAMERFGSDGDAVAFWWVRFRLGYTHAETFVELEADDPTLAAYLRFYARLIESEAVALTQYERAAYTLAHRLELDALPLPEDDLELRARQQVWLEKFRVDLEAAKAGLLDAMERLAQATAQATIRS